MRARHNLDPNRTKFTTAEMATAWLIFSIASAHGWSIEHMDICNAYVHDTSMFNRPVYVKEITTSKVAYMHGKDIGKLKRNYGAENLQVKITPEMPLVQRDGRRSVFVLQPASKGPALVAVTVDEVLVITPEKSHIDKFNTILTAKYKVKMIGKPR